MHCELANNVIYGNRITNFVPVTVIKDPGKIINFTYRSELQTQVLDESHVSWDGDYVLNDNCIVTDLCSGCESYAYGKSSHGNYRVTVRIVIPREGGRPRPSGPPPSYHRPSRSFWLLHVLSLTGYQKNHIFGTKLKSCLETYFIRSRSSSATMILRRYM